MTHAGNLPRHQYVSVDKSVLSQGQVQGWEEAVWFGLNSVPHRAWACTVMLKVWCAVPRATAVRYLPRSGWTDPQVGVAGRATLGLFWLQLLHHRIRLLAGVGLQRVDCQQAGVDGWQLYVYRRALRRCLQFGAKSNKVAPFHCPVQRAHDVCARQQCVIHRNFVHGQENYCQTRLASCTNVNLPRRRAGL
jgi:hypothetical protein